MGSKASKAFGGGKMGGDKATSATTKTRKSGSKTRA